MAVLMNDKGLRVVGVGLVSLGIILGYFFAYVPWEAAKNHATEVSGASKVLFLTPTALIFGLFLILFGQNFRQAIQKSHHGKQRLTVVGWVVIGLCIVGGIAANEWLKSALAALGYS